MSSTLELSIKLFENITMVKRHSSKYMSLLAASALYSLNIIMILDQQGSEDISWHEQYLSRFSKAIKQWIADLRVIGPFNFGGSDEHSWKGKQELEVKYDISFIVAHVDELH